LGILINLFCVCHGLSNAVPLELLRTQCKNLRLVESFIISQVEIQFLPRTDMGKIWDSDPERFK